MRAKCDTNVRQSSASANAIRRDKVTHVRKLLFLLDRDGCINKDVGAPGVLHAKDLVLLDGAANAIRKVREAGHHVAIVTNQSCRGKGLVSAEGLDEIHAKLSSLLAAEGAGWDALYVCAEVAPCPRKKPEPGMLLEAIADSGFTSDATIMIGDSWSDVAAARRAGCSGALVTTGHGGKLGVALARQGITLPTTLSRCLLDATLLPALLSVCVGRDQIEMVERSEFMPFNCVSANFRKGDRVRIAKAVHVPGVGDVCGVLGTVTDVWLPSQPSTGKMSPERSEPSLAPITVRLDSDVEVQARSRLGISSERDALLAKEVLPIRVYADLLQAVDELLSDGLSPWKLTDP